MFLSNSGGSLEGIANGNWGTCPENEEIQQWMLITSGEKIEEREQHWDSGASQVDCASSINPPTAFSDFMSSAEVRMDLSTAFMEDTLNEFLKDKREEKSPAREETAPSASSQKSIMEEYRQAKIADRRKRNRESSARCYYRRKRKEATLKAEWDRYRHRVLLLQCRRNELLRENSLLKMTVAAKNAGVLNESVPQEMFTFFG